MAHSSRKGGTRQPRRVASPARADVEALVYRWGPRIDPELLDLSLTHRSFAHETSSGMVCEVSIIRLQKLKIEQKISEIIQDFFSILKIFS